jgi:NAD(P)-dependent dehydrogenase (short-subunit alcohol dehydrogenase family)
MVNPLDGRVALVTGASGGIGEPLARALGACGARLGLVGRRLEALEAVTQGIGSPSRGVSSYAFNLSDDAQIQALARRVQEDLGGVDILIHSAGASAQDGLCFHVTADLLGTLAIEPPTNLKFWQQFATVQHTKGQAQGPVSNANQSVARFYRARPAVTAFMTP